MGVVVLVVLVVDIAHGALLWKQCKAALSFQCEGSVCKVDGDIAKVLLCMTSAASASSFCVMSDQVASVYFRGCESEQIIAELLCRSCNRFMKLRILHAS